MIFLFYKHNANRKVINFNKQKYYENEFIMLKDAHFQTSQKIITFFQYALLIFTAPLALLTSDGISNSLMGLIFGFIGLIEIIVIAYLTSLRVEALQYARQINRIRSIIYSEKTIGDNVEKIHNRKILFSQDKKPDYEEGGQFIYIVLVLGCFSAFYSFVGMYKLLRYYFFIEKNYLRYAMIYGWFMLLLAMVIYRKVCIKGENGTEYFTRKIGVDIDGVLNNHEETFVSICNQINGTNLEKSDITTLPVHDGERITLQEEQNVFKTKEYWEEQIPTKDVVHYLIEEIRNKYGYKPYIFTWRDWTVEKNINGEKVCYNMKKETKRWLKRVGIKYKKIRFEKGNIDRPVSSIHLKYWTRFYFAKKYKIQYFVEDNTNNAIKLSHICEYVFLFDHLYNRTENLPYNVIRVSSWKEIFDWIKKLN